MLHRHLNHSSYTLAAIDDVISRGRAADWAELDDAALNDDGVRQRIRILCERHKHDGYAQRYQFWRARVG